MLEPCNCSPRCLGILVEATSPRALVADVWSEIDMRIIRMLSAPKCVRCRLPCPDESVDPYWWEAGERMCDTCGLSDRPGPRPHRAKDAA